MSLAKSVRETSAVPISF